MTFSKQQRPKIFGTGLIALDVIISADPATPVRVWTGGTCGNVLSILAVLGWEAYPIARMNGDSASQRIRADMRKWGVRLKYTKCKPTTDTPIVIQHILRARDGSAKHRFSWSCPHCGSWLPSFKPVTAKALEHVAEEIDAATAFFMDRLSRSALILAEKAASAGAVVVFEPSARLDKKLLPEALRVAHILKYSDQRFKNIPGAMESGNATRVEVQTLGASGLRYRHRFRGTVSSWKTLPAISPAHVADVCGSGDWCTAGVVSMLARSGQKGLIEAGSEGLVEALRFGQKLAAWNVGFEGARGGMYAVERSKLDEQLKTLASDPSEVMQPEYYRKRLSAAPIACPACPPEIKHSESCV